MTLNLKRLSAGGNRGFSLTEVLSVVGVIGVLSAVALPNISKVNDSASESTARRNAQNLVAVAVSAQAAGLDFIDKGDDIVTTIENVASGGIVNGGSFDGAFFGLPSLSDQEMENIRPYVSIQNGALVYHATGNENPNISTEKAGTTPDEIIDPDGDIGSNPIVVAPPPSMDPTPETIDPPTPSEAAGGSSGLTVIHSVSAPETYYYIPPPTTNSFSTTLPDDQGPYIAPDMLDMNPDDLIIISSNDISSTPDIVDTYLLAASDTSSSPISSTPAPTESTADNSATSSEPTIETTEILALPDFAYAIPPPADQGDPIADPTGTTPTEQSDSTSIGSLEPTLAPSTAEGSSTAPSTDASATTTSTSTSADPVASADDSADTLLQEFADLLAQPYFLEVDPPQTTTVSNQDTIQTSDATQTTTTSPRGSNKKSNRGQDKKLQ